ncbi:hypothetical protein [Rhizobium sp. BK602]|uniref:chemotaxis protein CheT n=1 Tax=Rhizobium sp. BK602 TaxID=2586986 RepID=UPI0016131DE5|nr:hypothetical protein [Rhizobium sp. BK602]MBB3608278.1 hypothetical protein [Rhizobium sp. BK602]
MTITPRTDTSTMQEALPAILMRIVAELHDIAYLIERIEPQLLDLSEVNVLESPDAMKVLQGIDLAVQKTRGIAEFIDTISSEMPDGWMVDVATALSLVKLTEMQKALSGGLRHGHSQPLAKAAGDFDFF